MDLLKTYKNINNTEQDNSPEKDEQKIYKPSLTLLEWEAPERAFKKYSREFYRRISVILVFFSLILLLIQDFVVIIVLGVIFFVVYVFHSTPPRKVIHKITSNGVYYAMDYHYMWKDLKNFYFEKKDNIRYLVLNTVDPLPGKIFLIIDKHISNEELMKVLNQYLSFDENPEKNVYEEMIRAFRSKVKLRSFTEE